jgi:hypothetical protein
VNRQPLSSKYLGVHFNRKDQAFIAQLIVAGRHIHVASFKVADHPNAEILAAQARDTAALDFLGSKAILNFRQLNNHNRQVA